MIFFSNFRLHIVIIILLLLVRPENSVLAQNIGWSTPQTIPSFDVNSSPPILIADPNGNVHAFSSQFIEFQDDKKKVVVYNKWSPETGWTTPIDILISPTKEARVTDVYLDKDGVFHLVFFGGDGTGADIYYSKAPLIDVSNSRFWIEPFVIGDNASDPEGAVFTHTDQGGLVVVFNGRQFGSGLYAVKSDDHGDTWSFPVPIFIADDKAPNIAYLEAIESESGWLHVIWDVFNATGQGRGIYYARSLDGESWDQPTLLVETEEGLGSQTPTIVEHQGALFVIYILPPKVVMQVSNDNGLTWQAPVILFPRHVGVNGSLSSVVDENDILHLFFGQRISGNPDIHGMWHSTWKGNGWTEPEALIKGPQIKDEVGNSSFDPNAASAVVSHRNVILVTWRTDPGLKPNGVWYSFIKLNTSEAPATPGSIQQSTIPIPTATSSIQIPGADVSALADTNNSSIQRSLPTGSIISVVSLLLLALVVAHYFRKKNRSES